MRLGETPVMTTGFGRSTVMPFAVYVRLFIVTSTVCVRHVCVLVDGGATHVSVFAST